MREFFEVLDAHIGVVIILLMVFIGVITIFKSNSNG